MEQPEHSLDDESDFEQSHNHRSQQISPQQ